MLIAENARETGAVDGKDEFAADCFLRHFERITYKSLSRLAGLGPRPSPQPKRLSYCRDRPVATWLAEHASIPGPGPVAAASNAPQSIGVCLAYPFASLRKRHCGLSAGTAANGTASSSWEFACRLAIELMASWDSPFGRPLML